MVNRIRTRGRLPHWETEEATYFVTFRLFDSLPRPAVQAYEFERRDILERARQAKRELSQWEHRRLKQIFAQKIDRFLNTGRGACYLREPRVAGTVAEAFRHFDGKRYRLIAWCIMPNHVHVVFGVLPSHELAEIVHSWKSFTAQQANRLLGRTGEFWQREYYDHLVRDSAELKRVISYVVENPRKSGLNNWPWVEVYQRR
jgi:REP element-mobilizing transposase RayT